jgi:hypothetical protein
VETFRVETGGAEYWQNAFSHREAAQLALQDAPGPFGILTAVTSLTDDEPYYFSTVRILEGENNRQVDG